MELFLTLEQIDEAAQAVRSRLKELPEVGMILGTGLGELGDAVEDAVYVPYPEIPHWPTSTVQGHKGRLVIGQLAGKRVMVLQGRAHYYEGYSMSQVTLCVRVMQRLGVKTLFVTNAAGAIDPSYLPGDLMLIQDHLSLIAMTGPNPLRGPNLPELGERFPDMSQPYDPALRKMSLEVAKANGVPMHEGVYASLSGPSFETPADLRFLHIIGAHAVGMSTVPEVIVARHNRMRVLGISGISNKANLDGSTETTHEEVLEAGRVLVPRLKAVVLGVLERM